jgi:hypothetical protein
MLGRRNLLSAAFGGLTAAVTGVKPKEAASILDALPASTEPEPSGAAPYGVPVDNTPAWVQRALNAAYDAERRLRPDMTALPPHIAAMKSWSPAFKESEAEKERAAIRALLEEMHSDQRRARAIAKLMGFGA